MGNTEKLIERLRWLLRGDGLLVALFVLLLIFYLGYATQLRGGLMGDVVGPRTFPIILGVFGLGLCAVFFFRKTTIRRADEAEVEPRRSVLGELYYLIPLFITLAYVLLITTLGYTLSTFLYTAILVKLLGQRTWLGAAVFGIALTLASSALFTFAFEVRLPAGSIFPRPF